MSLEGSVRKAGGRVRITAQLNDVSTGSHVWAERYDRSVADVFSVQDEITEAIVASIEPQLYAAENFHAKRKPPDNMDAWELVMRALSHFWRVTQEDNEVAQSLLEKAIAIDPEYGQALGVLATSQTLGAYMGWVDMATIVPAAESAALAAIQADREDPWAHHALGCAYLLTRRFEASLAEFAFALHLNPNFSLAQAIYGLTLAFCGQWEKADVAARRALRLSPRDPLSALYYGVASYAQFVGRNYEEAMQLAQAAVRLRGDYVGAHSGCLLLPRPWPGKSTSPRPHCSLYAGHNPIFRWPGSRARCPFSRKPNESTIWKHFAGLAWISIFANLHNISRKSHAGPTLLFMRAMSFAVIRAQ